MASADKKKLTALLQSQQEDEDEQPAGAPAAAVYKTHSGGIVETLEDLKSKAESELSEARKAESTSAHNFAMMKQSLEDQMAFDTKTMNEEKSGKEAAEEDKATAEGDLTQTDKELAEAQADLKNANTNCMTVAADHEATVAARKEELNVIA